VQHVLNIVNDHSEVELGNFVISKARIKKITMFREKYGKFKSLDTLLELDGFGVKVLERFCDSVLRKSPTDVSVDQENRTSSLKMKNLDDPSEKEFNDILIKKQSFVNPVLLEKVRKDIRSVVAVQVDLSCISWTKLALTDDESTTESDSNNAAIFVEDWNIFEFGNEDKKFSLSDLIQLLLQLNDKIPSADAYVIEALPSPQATKQPGNILQVNVNVQKSQLFAMMGILLASRNNSSVESSQNQHLDNNSMKTHQNIFFLKTYLASRLYRVYIGNERVSTEHVIGGLLQEQASNDSSETQINADDESNMMFVPHNLRARYRKCSRVHREFLGHSMLVGLSFIKLCVLKCRKSIASLNLKNRKPPANVNK
jgi:transcription elongation factor